MSDKSFIIKWILRLYKPEHLWAYNCSALAPDAAAWVPCGGPHRLPRLPHECDCHPALPGHELRGCQWSLHFECQGKNIDRIKSDKQMRVFVQ